MSDEIPKQKTHHNCQRAKAFKRLYRSVFKVNTALHPSPSKIRFPTRETRVDSSNANSIQRNTSIEKSINKSITHFTAMQKEWLENRSMQEKDLSWPNHCFEHLVIVGLPHTMNIQDVILNIRKEQVKRNKSSQYDTSACVKSEKPHHTPPKPSFTPQLLYQYPEDKPLHMTPEQLVSFCFPHGVTPKLLKRSPSMSAFNEVVYGQQHFVHSDQSFVFLQKGGDDLPMFGVCYLVNQMLHTPPGLVKHKFKETGVPPSKHMVAAPRCYCLLSRYPFFELHFQVLNSVLGLERLDSISDHMNEVVKLPPDVSLFNCLSTKSTTPLCAMTPDPCAIRAFSASPTPPTMLQAFAARPSESDISSQTMMIASDVECRQAISETPIAAREPFSCHIIPDVLASSSGPQNRIPRRETGHSRSLSGQSYRECEISDSSQCAPSFPQLGGADSPLLSSEFRPYSTTPPSSSHRQTESADSEFLCTSASMPDLSTSPEKHRWVSDVLLCETSNGWTSVYSNLSLSEMLRYPSSRATRSWSDDQEGNLSVQKLLNHFQSLKVPEPGESLTFKPDEEGLQCIKYTRPTARREWRISQLSDPWRERTLIEEEAAFGLRSWTVAVLCRSLSLENILSLLAGAMLERQIVFFCSNIGILSSAVLALIPLLRPFAWQSFILPTLPTVYLEFLEAPVPFAMGIQHKTPEIAQRCTELIRVNLYKDKIKNSPVATCLPGYKALHSDLMPWHKKIQESSKYSRRPSHVVTHSEHVAVDAFLKVIRGYLSGLLKDLKRHTITDVSSENGVSLLLEESLIESFPQRDQPFMKAFAQTQMFSSFVDSVIGK